MKIKSFFQAGIGTASTQLLSLLMLPFLTRLYSPSEFAPWALGLAFVVFLSSISTLRYDLALLSERSTNNSSTLFWLIQLISTIVYIIIILAILIAYTNGWLFKGTLMSGSTWFVSAWLLLFIQNQVWTTWNQHHGAFLAISMSQLLNAMTMFSIQFYGAIYQDGGSFWLVVGSLSGLTISLMILATNGLRTQSRPNSVFNASPYFFELARKHRRFVQFSLPYSVFGAIRDRFPILLVGFWATSSQELGLYSVAWRLSNVPAHLTGSTIRPVVLRHAVEQGFAPLELYVNRILSYLVLIGVPILAILVQLPEETFGWLLGERWSSIGPYLAAFAFPAMAFSLSNWMDRLVDTAAGKPHINLWTEVISGSTSTLGLLLVLALGGHILEAVTAQSVLLTLNYLIFIYITYHIAGFRRVFLLRLLILAFAVFLSTYLLLGKLLT